MQLAAEFVRMQTEMTELQQYKAQLAEQIKENQELVDKKAPSLEEEQQVNRLKEEKVGLMCYTVQWSDLLLFSGRIIGFQRKTQRATLDD